ncbi:hypothetical protein DFH06DRAFT_1155145 [Mycena polygramma]|nr:hypothetical protein DFH06DRAFT_1155145 [Mycena polygramma]
MRSRTRGSGTLIGSEPYLNGGIDFSPRVWYNSEIQEHKMMTKQHPHLLDALYHDYPSLSQNTLQLQIGIIQDVCTFRDFDAKWLAADPSVREEHVLLALSRICSTANNLHDARKLCATELNLAYLTKDGQHLIGLLKAMVPQDISKPPSSLSYFPHPDWDALRIFHEKSSPSDLEKLVYQRMLVLRTKLICESLVCMTGFSFRQPGHVINTIFRSFLGLGVHNIVVSRGHTVRQELERDLGIKNKLPPGAQKGRQGCDSKICPNGFHQWVDIPKDKVFLRCKKCWEKQHREVKYCSKDCQRVDWKSGHKAICGKPLNFDTVAEIATSNQALVSTSLPKFASVVGPAKPGFQMSLSLQLHLIQLGVHPNTDYMLLPTTLAPPESGRNLQLVFPEPELKRLFRVVREKALTTGEKEPVAIMAHALCWWVSRKDYSGPITTDIVVDQIREEFIFDEIKTAVKHMEERQIRDPHKRP